MEKYLQSARYDKKSTHAENITAFRGIDKSRLLSGGLIDGENVTVLSSGALRSLFAEKKINIQSGYAQIEGIYTLCDYYDADYESQVTPEWVYQNVCHENVLAYENWEKANARLMIKGIGMPPKTENGYRNVVGAYADESNTYVFYDACYNLLDQRRVDDYNAVGNGVIITFDSGEDGEYKGALNVYRLTQVFLDVIGINGSVSTVMIDSRLDLIKEVTSNKYRYSLLARESGKNFKYVSEDYIPNFGESYTVYYDTVYTDLYPTLGDYTPSSYSPTRTKRFVRYCNLKNGSNVFSRAGEKLLVLPDMKLLEKSGGTWKLSAEKSENVPAFSAAIQQYDRLFGISGDTLYVSASGDCTDFSVSEENDSPGAAWKTVTADESGYTAIAAIDGRVAVFTSSSMLTVRGNELPFSLSHVANCGCYSQETVAVCNGELYFISENGVMRCGGGKPVCISGALPRTAELSLAKLSSANGLVIMSLSDRGEVWVFEPFSGQWSRLSVSGNRFTHVGRDLISQNAGGCEVYRLFEKYGDFSGKIGLENNGRKRLKGITLSANVGTDSELVLTDCYGRELVKMSADGSEVQSVTYRARGIYTETGGICIKGYGDVTLYGIRLEYDGITNNSRQIK